MKKETNNKLNVANRSLFISDNLPILEGINSRSVDLVYLDPPFNSNAVYSAPLGSAADGASFNDVWTLDLIDIAWVGQIAEKYPAVAAVVNAVGLAGGKGDKAYIIFMTRRLLELRRIMKNTATIYLHVDATMSHSLKLVMDAIFDKKNFLGEVIWNKANGSKAGKKWGNEHDTLLCYARDSKSNVFNSKDPALRVPFSETSRAMHFKQVDGQGRRYRERIVNGKSYIYYEKDGKFRGNIWNDIPSMLANSPIQKETTGYKTQKPLALLARIIKCSSNEGDVVLDPFCGCATACVAAELLGREWIGIDKVKKAQKLVKSRLVEAKANIFAVNPDEKVHIYSNAPARTDNEDTTVNPKEHKHELFGKQDGKCLGCKHTFPFRNLTVDHIIPQAKQGGNKKENLQLLCQACNSTKGKRSMSYLLDKLRVDGIIE